MKRALIMLLVVFVCGCQNQVGPTSPSTSTRPTPLVSPRGAGVAAGVSGLAARNDVFRARQGETLTVSPPGVLRNDTWPMGGVVPSVDFVISTLPPIHSFTNTNDGGFIFDLSVTPDLSGALSFDYLLHTATADSNVATVTLQIAP